MMSSKPRSPFPLKSNPSALSCTVDDPKLSKRSTTSAAHLPVAVHVLVVAIVIGIGRLHFGITDWWDLGITDWWTLFVSEIACREYLEVVCLDTVKQVVEIGC